MSGLYLILDSFGGTMEQVLLEGKEQANGRIQFWGPFTECNRANRNNRIYPEDVMKPEFERLMLMSEMGRLCGELDHPDDSVLRLERASHRITKLWWESKNIGWGQATTISTPYGLTLEAFFHEKIPVGVSSRGVGSGKPDAEGKLVIQPGYRCITYDAVMDPSYQDAWQSIRESIMDDIQKGRKRVSMATPQAISQQGNSAGYIGPVVTTKIEEAIDMSPLSPEPSKTDDPVADIFVRIAEIASKM